MPAHRYCRPRQQTLGIPATRASNGRAAWSDRLNEDILPLQRLHLSNLLEAIQRCAWFLKAAEENVPWPLNANILDARKKDKLLFGSLSAINERFAKLQYTLGAAMRHATLLVSEPTESFLQVLAFYEKIDVLESTAQWQRCRLARNLAAHAYETDYTSIADHFNTLHALSVFLFVVAARFAAWCREALNIEPSSRDFADALPDSIA